MAKKTSTTVESILVISLFIAFLLYASIMSIIENSANQKSKEQLLKKQELKNKEEKAKRLAYKITKDSIKRIVMPLWVEFQSNDKNIISAKIKMRHQTPRGAHGLTSTIGEMIIESKKRLTKKRYLSKELYITFIGWKNTATYGKYKDGLNPEIFTKDDYEKAGKKWTTIIRINFGHIYTPIANPTMRAFHKHVNRVILKDSHTLEEIEFKATLNSDLLGKQLQFL